VNALDPRVERFRQALQRVLARHGMPLVFTSGYRTRSQQAALYHDWLSGRSKYPAAPPGFSKHERGLAFDLAGSPPALEIAGRLARGAGFRWGGDFHRADPVHFESP